MEGYSTVDVLFYGLLLVSVSYENLKAVCNIVEYIMRKSCHVPTDIIKNKKCPKTFRSRSTRIFMRILI